MPEFRQCVKCVLDNVEVPDISFDVQGVCRFCRHWEGYEKVRRIEATNLPWVYDQMRKEGRGKKYDVLLGLSGGVDSSMCLHWLIENGIRPLCWSMDNGYNDPKADENVMRLVEGLKVPFIRKVLDLDSFKRLQAAFIRAGVKNLEIPTDHVLMASGYLMAREYGIKTIISGGNHATEGIMPPSYGHDAKDLTHIEDICRRFGGSTKGLPTMSLSSYLKARFIDKIRTVNLPDYYDYNREESIKVLHEKYGWKTYGEKHNENVFTVWFQNFWLPTIWKLDKRKPHYSSLINSGQMTKREAVRKLLEPMWYPEFGIEGKLMKKTVKRKDSEFKNEIKVREFLNRAYGLLKKRK